MQPEFFNQPIDWWIGIPVFALVLMTAVFVHELGHFIVAKLAGVKVEEFAIGFPPRLFSFKKGETVYAINLLPLGGYCKMLGEEDPTEPRSLARAPKRWRAGILLAGVTMNVIFAIAILTAGYMTGAPAAATGEVQVMSLVPNSPAATAGIQPGDVILSFNNTKVQTNEGLINAVTASEGKQSQVVIKRNNEEQTLLITPQYDQEAHAYRVGFAIQLIPTTIETKQYSLGEAFTLSVQKTGEYVNLMVSIPSMLMQGQISPAEARPVGLPGIAKMTADAATYTAYSGWLWPVLSLAGVLNLGLAMANILPLPALDGGRLVFVLIEALRGRRISPEKEGLVHLIGFGVLLALMIVVMAFDFTSPVPRIWGAH